LRQQQCQFFSQWHVNSALWHQIKRSQRHIRYLRILSAHSNPDNPVNSIYENTVKLEIKLFKGLHRKCHKWQVVSKFRLAIFQIVDRLEIGHFVIFQIHDIITTVTWSKESDYIELTGADHQITRGSSVIWWSTSFNETWSDSLDHITVSMINLSYTPRDPFWMWKFQTLCFKKNRLFQMIKNTNKTAR
jgi:hypothetical protein